LRLLASSGISNKVLSTQVELSQTQVELSQTQVELSQTQVELSQTQVELQELAKYLFFNSLTSKKSADEIFSMPNVNDELKVVFDKGAGMLAFPKRDKVMSEYIRKHGIWEPTEQDWIARNVRAGHLVLNIGANLGVHAIVASKFVGAEGKVISFECHPEIANLLALNLAVNRIENVLVVSKAVAEFDGKGVLFCSTDNTGDNRLFNSNDFGHLQYEVEVIRLDTYLNELEIEPNIVIMDIQGLELAAIRGLGKKLAQGGKILFEFTPRWIDSDLSVSKNQLCEILESGYSLFNLGEFGIEIPIAVDELIEKFTLNQELLYLNLVLWKV
jgi:FkbM family methyltransferase